MKKYKIEFKEKSGRFYSDLIEQTYFFKILKEIKKDIPRLITATGFANSGGEFFIYYHFEISKKIYTFRTSLIENKAKTISSVFPGASWIERELAELYKIEFDKKLITLFHLN
jgi:NADH:ubiquinone oxidoreductase subunit C